MALEDDFRAALFSNANLAALLSNGTLATFRLYRDRLMQGTAFPAGRYQRISTVRTYSQQGYSGLSWARIQIELVSEDDAQIDAAVTDVLAAVTAFRPMASGRGANKILMQRDCQYPDLQPPLYGQVIDVKIWFNEPKESF